MANAELADVGLQGSADRYGTLCVHGVLDLRRSFTRAEVERAMYATVASFPLLGCVYERRFFRDQWAPRAAPISDMVHYGLEHDVETDTKWWTNHWIDPAKERPFRIVYLPKASGCRLVMSISHTFTDGAGMAAVAHVFGAHLCGVRPGLPVEKRRDIRRTLDGLKLRHIPVFARDLARNLVLPWRVWAASPRNRPYPVEASGQSYSKQVVIEKSTIDALEARCGKRLRINDLLVAVVSMVAAKRSDDGPLSVMYTMDLRRYSQSPHLSAANVSSILTTIVPRRATANIVDAVRAVELQTKKHREGLAGPAFLLLPMMLTGPAPHEIVRHILPALHPLLVELPASRGFIFTNVGKLDQGLGPLADDIEDIRIFGPNLEGVSVPAIIAWGLRGRVVLQLFAPPGLSEKALDELADELRSVFEVEAS